MLQKVIEQFRQVFGSMPMPSRIIAGLLVVAIALSLGFLVRTGGEPNTEYLLGGRLLDQRDLDAAEVAFGTAGLTGWSREGRRIKIPTQQRSEFLAALEQATSLPISLRTSVQSAIEQSSPFESSAQRLSREMHAKEIDLGNKIAAFPDVRWASVEYDRGERLGLSRDRPQSASVFVQPDGADPLTRARVQMIKEMIRGSFAGMSQEDVVVIDTNASTAPGLADEDDPLLRKRREAEASFENKIRAQLAGYGPIRVAAYAEIDPTLGTEKAILKYGDQPTTLSESSRRRETESSRPMQGGTPGATPNTLSSNRPAKLGENMQVSRSKDDERTSEKVTGQEYETSRVAALQVKRVRVSIGLPRSYFEKVWPQEYLQANPGTSLEEIPAMQTADLQKLRDQTKLSIQAAITPMLPDVAAGEDRYPLVEVWDYPDLPVPQVATASTGSVAAAWLADSWQTIALVLLAVVALFVARSAISSIGGDAEPTDFREGFGLELPPPPAVPEEEDSEAASMEITGGTLKDELVSLVEKNPEVAANVIRGWVADAA